MRFACPYCNKTNGYYRCDTVRMVRGFTWDKPNEHIRSDVDEVLYQGTKLKCLNCQEVVTSFVRGLQRELAND